MRHVGKQYIDTRINVNTLFCFFVSIKNHTLDLCTHIDIVTFSFYTGDLQIAGYMGE